MSKIDQIQRALRELSGGAFQKVADAYLHKRGYEQINPIGSVIGADKTKGGTPDTLAPLPSGRYVFAEYTTQQSGLYGKLAGDLEKCFDEAKVEVPIEKIEEVVFCHTSTLEPKEENDLVEECQKHGVNLNIFGIGPISYDLYQKYPSIARDFLGVEVDTGQIVSPDEFVVAFGKNKLTTRLDTAFHFREQEIEQVLQGLEISDLVIISGRPGVGKSRLALECCEQFGKSHPDHKMWCIFNRGPDLYEDLRVYFSDSGFYLILVDDANRVSRFEYVVQILQSQREDQQFKVIATVRDYARDKVLEAALSYGGGTEVELQPMQEKQIRKLVEEEYGILNPLYLDRIAEIAGGNPRLAIMAAELAKQENTLHSISDVSALYDEYFASIRYDLADLADNDLLKAAGIVTFFRVVDRSNDKMVNAIQEAFGISLDELWKAARQLHDLEIFDMYEDEVVRASDQVLATYLFYLVFFKEQVLDFSALLHHFFPSLRHRLVDAVYPALSAFHAQAIIEMLRPHVDNAWESFAKASDGESLLQLMEVFWFAKETDILLLIRDLIATMEPAEVALSDLEFTAKSDMKSPSLLTVLSSFRHASINSFRMALDLLFKYLAKRPGDLGSVLYLLKDRFGFEHTSYARGFEVQRAVIDVLWEHTDAGENEFFSKLFLTIAKPYLHTRFHTTEARRDRSVAVINFELFPTPELSELRQTIWNQLFLLYQLPAMQQEVLNVFQSYCTDSYAVSIGDILAQDAEYVLPFIESELDPNNYRHCYTVCSYLDSLERHKVNFDEGLRDRFKNETYALSELLLDDWARKRKSDMDYQEFEKAKRKRIEEHFDGYGIDDYEQFFQHCLKIKSELNQDHKMGQLQEAVVLVLLILASRDPSLYVDVLKLYLGFGELLRLRPIPLIARLTQICGSKKAIELISQEDYPTKRLWLFGYYRILPPDDASAEHLKQLYALYREAEHRELLLGFDYLLKYLSLDKHVVARVTEIILEKAENDSNFVSALSSLFNSYSEVSKMLIDLFDADLGLLKRAYFEVSATNSRHSDHNGVTFARILDHDPDFVLEYIDWMYSRRGFPQYDDTRDYSVLWMRDDCELVMTRVVERIYEHERDRGLLDFEYLGTFFGLAGSRIPNPQVQNRRDRFLKGLIESRHDDSDFMQFVFGIVAQFPPKLRRSFIASFLEYNKVFEAFERLPLESGASSWWGSAVPMLQERMGYFESLLPLLNTVDLLRHKQHVERRIQGIQLQIEQEKKRDFVED